MSMINEYAPDLDSADQALVLVDLVLVLVDQALDSADLVLVSVDQASD